MVQGEEADFMPHEAVFAVPVNLQSLALLGK
jgi:hypothetical protein